MFALQECPAEEQWKKTQGEVMKTDLQLDKATQEEIRRVKNTLGPAADEFEVVEALCSAGIPDVAIEREMKKLEERSKCYFILSTTE